VLEEADKAGALRPADKRVEVGEEIMRRRVQ